MCTTHTENLITHLLLAPTVVVAINIKGTSIHTALAIPAGKFGKIRNYLTKCGHD